MADKWSRDIEYIEEYKLRSGYKSAADIDKENYEKRRLFSRIRKWIWEQFIFLIAVTLVLFLVSTITYGVMALIF